MLFFLKIFYTNNGILKLFKGMFLFLIKSGNKYV